MLLMCPVFTVLCVGAVIHVCVYVNVCTCIFLAVVMKLSTSGTPSPREARADTHTHTHTHTVLLYFSHFQSHTFVRPKQTHQCVAYIFSAHLDEYNHTCANNTITCARHAWSHMHEYSKSAPTHTHTVLTLLRQICLS